MTDAGTTTMEARPQRLWFPVFYPAEELEDWLNRKFDRVIANTFIPYRSDSVLLTVSKPGKIELVMTGDSVEVVFPLEIELTEDRPEGREKRIYRKLTGALNLYLNIMPDVNRNWEITTRTALKGYEWTARPRLETGGIKIGVKFLADYLLRNELRELPGALDEALREKVDLKKGLNRTWSNLQKPLPVYRSDSTTLWFRIEPDSLWGDIKVEPGGLLFNLAVNAWARVHQDSSQFSRRRPLPDFRPLKRMQQDSNVLEILAAVPLDVVNRELKKAGRGYSSGRPLVFPEISDIKMRGYGRKVAFDLQTGGSTPASLTVIGTPEYDARRRTLVVINPDYDLDTDHKMLNAVDKRFREGILSYLEKKAILDIGRYMNNLPGYLNQTLNEGNHSDKFRLLFSEIEVRDIRHATNDSEFLIWLSCKPRFEITLKKLPVKKKVRL
ncbi:MAG: DUF4403 family protein [Leadbetterella sp.]|nr:DUF4403 family protein [Leadbetterella sp.]